jgi:hypothetical protein
MVWFFARSGQELRVVTRFDSRANEYVVEIEWPGRDTILERYADYAVFNARVQRLHLELLESRWTQNGSPALIEGGWRGPTSRS